MNYYRSLINHLSDLENYRFDTNIGRYYYMSPPSYSLLLHLNGIGSVTIHLSYLENYEFDTILIMFTLHTLPIP